MTRTKCLLLAPIIVGAQQPKPAPGYTNPLGHSEQAIEQGREIFNHNCTVCHGVNGATGDRGPVLGAPGATTRAVRIRPFSMRFRVAFFGTNMPPSGLAPMDI